MAARVGRVASLASAASWSSVRSALFSVTRTSDLAIRRGWASGLWASARAGTSASLVRQRPPERCQRPGKVALPAAGIQHLAARYVGLHAAERARWETPRAGRCDNVTLGYWTAGPYHQGAKEVGVNP